MVAGAISSPDPEKVRANIDALNQASLAVLDRGFVPIVAHSLAAPIRELDPSPERKERYYRLCVALAERCDAILVLSRSPGVDLELGVFERAGKPIYSSIQELPPGLKN
jgi:nucleoside 2-deoxyribosyltransferase